MAPNICLSAKIVVRNVSLMDICDIPIQALAAISPAVKHLANVTFIKKFCWNFERCICIISGSQCLKPHTSCILELVLIPFFEIDNSSIWFQSWDKNFHRLELRIRCIARFAPPPFLSNYSCPFIQLITFLFSFVYSRVVNGLVSVTCFVSFFQATHSILSWLLAQPEVNFWCTRLK